MAVSGFTGGEAEELRRAMGFKRSVERMESIERRLRDGMAAKGITGENQDRIVQSITSFALYGFPESHAASFALIAYASAYLKCHHPTAFLIGLLNAWPMGFYHPATLVQDAQRHGVTVRPIDVNFSSYECKWEDIDAEQKGKKLPSKGKTGAAAPAGPNATLERRRQIRPGHHRPAAGACRLGLRYVEGLRKAAAETIVRERRAGGPFRDADDLARRTGSRPDELERLATVGALASLGLTRRESQWQVALAARPTGELFDSSRLSMAASAAPASPLPEMSRYEETVADFVGTGLTVGAHPLAYWRERLERHGVIPAATLPERPRGTRTRIAGAVIVRQRPGTAKGTLFLTLEDETGMAQAIVAPQLFHRNRPLIVGNPGLVVEGVVESKDGSISLRAERFWPLPVLAETPSHDFR